MLHQFLSVVATAACACAWTFSVVSPVGYRDVQIVQPRVAEISKSIQITEKVNVDVYYESLCSDSIKLYRQELHPLVKKLGSYINLRTFPYGKASTNITNGMITFHCQHGEAECYGNKLLACAKELVGCKDYAYVDFNECMLAARTNDAAADQCGKTLHIDSKPIKVCAAGDRGTQLLKYYGEESSKVTYTYIPHVVINGTPMKDHADLMISVCKKFRSPPAVCIQS